MAARACNTIAVILFFTAVVRAQGLNSTEVLEPDQAQAATGAVELEKQEDYSLSYKKRRGTHGVLFSVGMEKFYPIDYRSLFNDAYIEEIIQENRIDLVGIELGYKHNMSFFSISVLGGFFQGAIVGARSGERTLSISKQGVSANVAIDGMLEEPWIAPYVQAGVHQFNVTESNAAQVSESATTGLALNYRYGLLFQLDWIENSIDKESKAERLRSSGLENTYIDVYFAGHQPSRDALDPLDLVNEGDPNMLSSGEMGLGLKMEF